MQVNPNELISKFKKKEKEFDFYSIWDYFMKEYGYISKEEFMAMPLEDINSLITIINERNEEINKRSKK